MSRLMAVILVVALLVSAAQVFQQFAPAIAYARAWDAGENPAAFTTLAGLESTQTDWIVECRDRWLQLSH